MTQPSLLAACALAALLAARAGADDHKAARDDDRLQGTWKISEATMDGQKVAPEEVASIRFTFAKGALEFQGGKTKDRGRYQLNTAATPRAVDMLDKDGKVTARGIYKFDGDALVWCYVKSPGERPAKFEAKEKSGALLLRLEKVKDKRKGKE